MRTSRWMMLAALAAGLSVGATQGLAQQESSGNRDGNRESSRDRSSDRGGDRGARFGGRFDPAQFRERMMENFRERLEIKDDAEWKEVQPRLEKVMEVGRQVAGDRMRGMFRRPGEDRGGDRGPDRTRSSGGMLGQSLPEADALERAIEAKASNSELKAAVAKYNEARKAKQAELEKAQTELRQLLSVKQEAVLTLAGLL